MLRPFVLAALLLTSSASAATISGTSCPGAGCSLSYVADAQAMAVQVTGTWAGTIIVEVSLDAVTFFPTRVWPANGDAYSAGLPGNGIHTAPTWGATYMRFRATSWTSGTATVTTRPSAAVIPADLVRAVGPTNGAVQITGAVTADLSEQSIAAIGPQPYTLRTDDWVSVSSASAIPVPANLPDGGTGALPGRTELRIINTSSTSEVVCDPPTADGGLPEWGVRGTPLFSNGGYGVWEVRDSVRVYCRARPGGPVLVAPLEKAQ